MEHQASISLIKTRDLLLEAADARLLVQHALTHLESADHQIAKRILENALVSMDALVQQLRCLRTEGK